jgi:hypothetical protein
MELEQLRAEYKALHAKSSEIFSKIMTIEKNIKKDQNDKAIALADKHKSRWFREEWTKLIEERFMRDNVESIMRDCIHSIKDGKKKESVYPVGSDAWYNLVIDVIRMLLENGSFGTPKDGFDNFEDTCGCDEIVWGAMEEILADEEN